MEKKSNEMYVYTVYSKVSKKHNGLFYHYTDEEMVQKSLPIILMDYSLRDIEVYKIAIFNDDEGVLTMLDRTEKVDVMCYTFPHSRLSPEGENLSLEEIETHMKEQKNKLVAMQSSNIDESKKEDK